MRGLDCKTDVDHWDQYNLECLAELDHPPRHLIAKAETC